MRRWPIVLFGITLAVRLINVGGEALWYDEAFTAGLAALPLDRMMQAIGGDVHPPLFYLIEWGIGHLFGRGEIVLRLAPALFSAAAAVQLYHYVSKIHTEKAGRWAALMFALLPGQIYYGREARMYSLLVLLVIAALDAIQARRWWRFWPIIGLILYTHNFGPIYAGLLALVGGITRIGGVSWRQARSRLARWALGGAATGALYAPWMLTLIRQIGAISGGYWIPPAGNFGGVLYYLYFTTIHSVPIPAEIHLIALPLILTVIAVYKLARGWRRYYPLFVMGFGPPLALALASIIWRPVLLPRGLMPAGAVVVALWGIMLVELAPRARRQVQAIALPLIVLSAGYYIYTTYTTPRIDLGYLDTIRAEWQPGDVVYSSEVPGIVTADYYAPDLPHYLLPERGNLIQSLTEQTKEAMHIDQHELNFDELPSAGYKRAWILEVSGPMTSDLERARIAEILARYPLIKRIEIFHSPMLDHTLDLVDLQ